MNLLGGRAPSWTLHPFTYRELGSAFELARGSPEFGEAFESFVFHELSTFTDYTEPMPLAYWRSTSNFEVDFVLADTTAIEVKGKEPVGERDLRGLRALKEEGLLKHYLVVSVERRPRSVDGIRILPWQDFLEQFVGGGVRVALGPSCASDRRDDG